LFDVGDNSRLDPFEERGDDAIETTLKDPLKVPHGLITKSKAKKSLKKYSMDLFKVFRPR
jgi:hypothetical protein